MINLEYLHYTIVGITVALPSLGVAFGQAWAARSALKALNTQPSSYKELSSIFFISMALSETGALLSTIMGIFLIKNGITTLFQAYANIGIALAISVPAFIIGLASALPSSNAFQSIARQPFLNKKIMNLLLISQAIIQTPVIFGFIIGWFINQQALSAISFAATCKLIASGISIAVGSIGPTIGIALFAQQACKSVGTDPLAYNDMVSFTFLSQAMIETPIIFSLVISLMILFSTISTMATPLTGLIYILAAFITGFATLAAGISSGKVAAQACKQIGQNRTLYTILSRTSIVSQTLIDTNAIYGLTVSLLLLLRLQ